MDINGNWNLWCGVILSPKQFVTRFSNTITTFILAINEGKGHWFIRLCWCLCYVWCSLPNETRDDSTRIAWSSKYPRGNSSIPREHSSYTGSTSNSYIQWLVMECVIHATACAAVYGSPNWWYLLPAWVASCSNCSKERERRRRDRGCQKGAELDEDGAEVATSLLHY